MDAEVLSIKDRGVSTRSGGLLTLICLKGNDGQSYSTWVDSSLRNAKRWGGLKVGDTLSGLRVKKNNLIDADSQFTKEG